MNNKGIISLVVLLFILISFIFVIYLENMSKSEYLLTYNNYLSDKLYNIARSCNNIVLYNDCYRELLFETIGKQLYNRPISLSERVFKIEDSYLKKSYDLKNIFLGRRYFVEGKRVWFELKSEVEDSNIKRSSSYFGYLINEIFESDEFLYDDVEVDYINSLALFFLEEEEGSYDDLDINRIIYKDRLDLTLNILNNVSIDIIEDLHNKKTLKNNKLILKLLRPDSNLHIYSNDRNYLEGLIYVNGDLYIQEDFKFYGILIVTGDVYIGNKLSLYGKQFINGFIDNYKKEYIYVKSYAYKYGIFMPDFFNIDIKLKK